MGNVILYIGMSLDGFIADQNGQVGWMLGHDPSDESSSYPDFIKDIGTVIMGYNTYHQIVTELSPYEWVYHGLSSYVLTHHDIPYTDEIQFTKEDIGSLVKRLKQEESKGIWICGGANIVRQLIQADLIDRYHISVIPTILGGGIRLFDTAENEIKLRLIDTQSYNGITDLIYEHR